MTTLDTAKLPNKSVDFMAEKIMEKKKEQKPQYKPELFNLTRLKTPNWGEQKTAANNSNIPTYSSPIPRRKRSSTLKLSLLTKLEPVSDNSDEMSSDCKRKKDLLLLRAKVGEAKKVSKIKIHKAAANLNRPVFIKKKPSLILENDCSPTNFHDISKIEKQVSISSSTEKFPIFSGTTEKKGDFIQNFFGVDAINDYQKK